MKYEITQQKVAEWTRYMEVGTKDGIFYDCQLWMNSSINAPHFRIDEICFPYFTIKIGGGPDSFVETEYDIEGKGEIYSFMLEEWIETILARIQRQMPAFEFYFEYPEVETPTEEELDKEFEEHPEWFSVQDNH